MFLNFFAFHPVPVSVNCNSLSDLFSSVEDRKLHHAGTPDRERRVWKLCPDTRTKQWSCPSPTAPKTNNTCRLQWTEVVQTMRDEWNKKRLALFRKKNLTWGGTSRTIPQSSWCMILKTSQSHKSRELLSHSSVTSPSRSISCGEGPQNQKALMRIFLWSVKVISQIRREAGESLCLWTFGELNDAFCNTFEKGTQICWPHPKHCWVWCFLHNGFWTTWFQDWPDLWSSPLLSPPPPQQVCHPHCSVWLFLHNEEDGGAYLCLVWISPQKLSKKRQTNLSTKQVEH